jgi:hypothetical protein
MSTNPARIEPSDPLRKPVNTLAIVPKSQKITVLGRKAYNVMLHMAQLQGVEKDIYAAPLADIVTGLDYGSNDLELIKKHLRAMASTVVEWNSPTTGEGADWTVSALVSHARIYKKGGQNWLEWDYAKPLKQELLKPSVFAKLSVSMLSQMHTHAGVALYEICSRYRVVGRTSRQDWRWWLPVLTGQPNSERLEKTEFRFFKRDTIKPAIAEVCAITDLEIELVEYKQGKSISDLQFLIKPKAQAQLPLANPPRPVDLALVKKAVSMGIKEEKAEELLIKHGEIDMSAGLKSLETRLATNFPEPIRDPFRYLKTVLAGDSVKQPLDQVDSLVVVAQATAAGQKKQIEKRAEWTEGWLRVQREKVVALLETKSESDVQILEAELLETMTNSGSHPTLIKRLQASGWRHPLVKRLMIDFYAPTILGGEWNKPSTEDLLTIAAQ